MRVDGSALGQDGLEQFWMLLLRDFQASVHRHLWLLAQLKWSSRRTWLVHLSIWQVFVEEHSEVSFFIFPVYQTANLLWERHHSRGWLISLLAVEKAWALMSKVQMYRRVWRPFQVVAQTLLSPSRRLFLETARRIYFNWQNLVLAFVLWGVWWSVCYTLKWEYDCFTHNSFLFLYVTAYRVKYMWSSISLERASPRIEWDAF